MYHYALLPTPIYSGDGEAARSPHGKLCFFDGWVGRFHCPSIALFVEGFPNAPLLASGLSKGTRGAGAVVDSPILSGVCLNSLG